MALIPAIQLPWARKTPIQRAQDELPKVNTDEISTAVEETARAAAHGIEALAGQVAVAAGKLGKQAGKAGREASKRGLELSRELGDELARSDNIRQLRHDLGAIGHDVRQLRVTREKKRGRNMLPGIALLAGLSGGMATMYFFDPEHGTRRRALLRDQLGKWSRITSEQLECRAKDLRNRSAGLAHEVRKAVEGTEGVEGVEIAAPPVEAIAEMTPEAKAEPAPKAKVGARH